jgi:ABC-type multidrug transport system fused ATPase/permease subunit
MDKGMVAEFDSPLKLMENSASIFYSMCKKSGNFDDLKISALGAAPSN